MKIACVTPDNKRDYLCETVLEGLHALGHQLVVSDPGNGFCKQAMLDGDFKSAADSSDAMLVFFGKQRNNRPPRRYFLDQVQLPKSRIAYIDGSEWSCTGWESGDQAVASLIDPKRRRGEPWIDEDMFQRCGWYFKRECYPEDTQRGIIPLPFAMSDRHILRVDSPKDIDVFCSFGHVKTGLRKDIIGLVQHFMATMDPTAGLNVVLKSGMPQDEYRATLARSRIVIDAWGGGDTNDRFWEAVGAGACCLYQQYNVVMPNPFVDFQHAVSFSTISELSNRLHRLVYGSEAEDIGENGLTHALCFHTAKHRAEEILKHVVP
jgi:hypothetical protein